MSPLDGTPTVVRPDELGDLTASDRVAIGERVAEMCDSQAWADMRRGVRGKQAGIAAYLMGQPGDRDRGVLTKAIGEMSGVALIDVIAAELIADGEAAGQEIRAREEGF